MIPKIIISGNFTDNQINKYVGGKSFALKQDQELLYKYHDNNGSSILLHKKMQWV